MSDMITIWCQEGRLLDAKKRAELQESCKKFQDDGYEVSMKLEIKRGFDIYGVEKLLNNLLAMSLSQVEFTLSKEEEPLAQEISALQHALMDKSENYGKEGCQVYKLGKTWFVLHCRVLPAYLSYCVPGTFRQP